MSKLFDPRTASHRAHSDKGSLEAYVEQKAVEYALLSDRAAPEEFLRFCIAGMPRSGERDTRRQRLIRCIRRLDDRGELPFRIDAGGAFVFG